MLRSIRVWAPRLAAPLAELEQGKAQLGLAHSYSRAKVKFNVNRVDNMIIQVPYRQGRQKLLYSRSPHGTVHLRCMCWTLTANADFPSRSRSMVHVQPNSRTCCVPGCGMSCADMSPRWSCSIHDMLHDMLQAIALLDTLDKDVNTFVMRVREWYSWHFPELVKVRAHARPRLLCGAQRQCEEKSLRTR